MYDRVFTFGCSFTKYRWPTWADIVGNSFGEDKFYNFGRSGSGNICAFNRVLEANTKYKFTKKDLILICWTNYCREDRYIKGRWLSSGNIFSQQIYDKEWVSNWFDLRGALIKSSNSIAAVTELLNKIGCEYHYTSMIDYWKLEQFGILYRNEDQSLSDIFEIYKEYYDLIDKRSMAPYLYDGSHKNPVRLVIRTQPDGTPVFDHHPNPKQHLRYAEEVVLPKLNQNIQVSDDVKNLVEKWQNKIFEKEIWQFPERYQTKHYGQELF